MDKKILAIGVFMADQANNAMALTNSLLQTKNWELDVRWAACGSGKIPKQLAPFTSRAEARKPKFELLNGLLESVNLEDYHYLCVTDDDIEFPENFLDIFLGLQEKYAFGLAQPARTHDSYIDHKFVAQLLGIEARRTRFVEIGPMFSIARQVYPRIVPFDITAPMGWGLDFVWPVILEEFGASLGIIDAAPVRHAMRKPVALYDYNSTATAMLDFLSKHHHLETNEAFRAIETYPIADAD